LRQCFVCFDEVDVDAGVECRTGHFMCAVCLNEEVKTQVSRSLRTRTLVGSGLMH
jgi:hypothetical protein